ncbi:MAG: hypothetical protein LBB72_01715 [Spirochaetaceae bacterium]|jgi:hypothetical protein|nr:hypothetical protein [Spirochaetaceae bacterium]
MPANEQKLIKIPVKLVFTEVGSTAMMRQNLKISRLKMGDNTDDYGIVLDKAAPPFIQGMITADYISKIEISGVEPIQNRSDIIELSKVIVFSVLYRNYALASQEQVLASETVKRWNHSNPSQVIDEKTLFQSGVIQAFLEKYPDELRSLQKELVDPIRTHIETDKNLEADEKNIRVGLLNNFVSSMYPFVWFILLRFRQAPDFINVLKNVRGCLLDFLGKTNIAEYAGLMLMELATNIENLIIQKEAKLLYRTNPVDAKSVIQDPKLRLPVIESLRKKNSLLTFSWKLGGARMAMGSRGRFQVLLYDQDVNFAETRGNVDQTKAADAGRSNLSEFYKNLHRNGNELDLGMFYLSFLDEACDKMGIKFESMVNQYGGQTITTLTFTL